MNLRTGPGICGLLLVIVFFDVGTAQSFGSRDTDFIITLSRRTEDPTGLHGEIVSTTMYPCAGYRIRSEVTWEQDTIGISISGFVRPSPCISTGAEATGTVYLGNPGIGTFVVRIYYRGDIDLHRMRISKHRITFTPLRNDFTSLNLQF